MRQVALPLELPVTSDIIRHIRKRGGSRREARGLGHGKGMDVVLSDTVGYGPRSVLAAVVYTPRVRPMLAKSSGRGAGGGSPDWRFV